MKKIIAVVLLMIAVGCEKEDTQPNNSNEEEGCKCGTVTTHLNQFSSTSEGYIQIFSKVLIQNQCSNNVKETTLEGSEGDLMGKYKCLNESW